MKQLPVLALKWCVGAPLCNTFVPGGFGQRVGSDMSVSHIFPQGVLAAFTFVGSGAEIEVLEPAPSVSWALSSVQCGQLQPLRDRSRSQVAGTEAQRVRSKLAASLLCVCCFPSQHLHPHLSREQCWSKRSGCLVRGGSYGCSSSSRTLDHSRVLPLQVPAMAVLAPFRCVLALRQLCPAQLCPLLGHRSTSPSVKLCC